MNPGYDVHTDAPRINVVKYPGGRITVSKALGKGDDLVAIARVWYYAMLWVVAINCATDFFRFIAWVTS